MFSFFFFFNDTATTEIYTLSLHDALPIFATEDLLSLGFQCVCLIDSDSPTLPQQAFAEAAEVLSQPDEDRKSTRLNSSHSQISYAVFCLKKKKKPKGRSITQHYKSDSDCR